MAGFAFRLCLGTIAASFILTASAGVAEQPEDELHEAEVERGFEVAVFLGVTELEGSESADPSVGAELGYRFGRWISLVAFVDYVPETDEIAIGLPVLVHLGREDGVKLLACFGGINLQHFSRTTQSDILVIRADIGGQNRVKFLADLCHTLPRFYIPYHNPSGMGSAPAGGHEPRSISTESQHVRNALRERQRPNQLQCFRVIKQNLFMTGHRR